MIGKWRKAAREAYQQWRQAIDYEVREGQNLSADDLAALRKARSTVELQLLFVTLPEALGLKHGGIPDSILKVTSEETS